MNPSTFDTLETGDILLFNGRYFSSRIVEYFTNSLWSHVALVVKNPDFLMNRDGSSNGLFLFESSGTSIPDIDTGKLEIGVQIHDLKKYITEYDGDVYVRRLKCSLSNEQRTELIKSVYETLYNKKYDTGVCDLIDLVLHSRRSYFSRLFDYFSSPRNTNQLVCSGLVAYTYTICGFLKKTTQWSYITPSYFIEEIDGDLQEKVSLCNLEKVN